MKIEVSHESPLCILKESRSYNDYDYALVHLFEEYPDYYDFFKQGQNLGRSVLLDNSIFELGKAFDDMQYSKWIERLDPNYYIVPDVLFDGAGTIGTWKNFLTIHHDSQSDTLKNRMRIGVVTGKDYADFLECYKFMSEHADYIALGFNYPMFTTREFHMHVEKRMTFPLGDFVPADTMQLQAWCIGRQNLIADLIAKDIWNWSKPHHLLGCSLAREFSWYHKNNIWNIKSCDTSNPIVAAIEGLRYNDEFGLNTKPKTKLADLIEAKLDDTQREDLQYNVNMFKKILGR